VDRAQAGEVEDQRGLGATTSACQAAGASSSSGVPGAAEAARNRTRRLDAD